MSDLLDWGTFKEQSDYLKKRGVDEITTKRLGIEVMTESLLEKEGIRIEGQSRGILWRLKDINGVLTGKVGARLWYKVGFLPNDEKPKFVTPTGQVPGLYFSPLINWDKLEYGQRVYICESYLKADIVCLLGHHAIGISGCWGWSYQKQLIWDFQQLPWRAMGLVPVVCFDSNVYEGRPKLLQAATKLRAELDVRCRVDAHILVLPPPNPDDHWGIDDFYARNGKEATLAHLNGETTPLPNEILEHLKIMNTQVCLITDIKRFVDIETGNLMKREEFENIVYADRMADDPEGKKISVAKIWTKWDGRNTVPRLAYKPGEERLKEGEWFNIWKGMGTEPLAADVGLFLSWVYEVFDTDTERLFFLNWWAWQLQNMGKKMTTSLVIVGKSGIGKGWIARIAELIWGMDNISKNSLGQLDSRFNSELANKQLLIVEESDDMSAKSGGAIYNRMKDLITNPQIRLERKGMDAIMVDNTLNVFITGNRIEIFKLDTFDRRFMVCEARDAGQGICNSAEYWKPRWEWIERGGGAAAIYGYLLSRDLAGFDPYGEAPLTKAKEDMIDITHLPMEVWVEELMGNAEEMMNIRGQPVDGRLATAKELLFVYYDGQKPMHEITKVEATKMNAILKNARFRVASNGSKIKVDGVPNRYFLLSGPDESPNWAGEVKGRVFWSRLVASAGPQVASERPPGNREEKW